MDITGEYRIAASREQVWSALNDPAMLQRCIPGCEHLEMLSETEVVAKILARVGPVKSRFSTRIQLTDLDPPSGYTIIGEGQGGVAGFGKGSANVTLVQDGEATVLSYQADLKVGGKLAQVGSRLVLAATRKTADDFFSTFSTELDPGAEKLVSEEELAAAAGSARRKRVLIWTAAAIALAALLWLLLG